MKKRILSSFLDPKYGVIALREVTGDAYRYFTILSADGQVCKTGTNRSLISREFAALRNLAFNSKTNW